MTTQPPPQCVDLQVNGYAGVDFNQDNLSAADLHQACQRLREDGVAGILATIITDELPRMTARLARIAWLCQLDPVVREIIWGLHIEGPFINETPGFVGRTRRTPCARRIWTRQSNWSRRPAGSPAW